MPAVDQDRPIALPDDAQRVVLLIWSVDAGVHVAVVIHDLPLRCAVSPFGMLLINRSAHLREIGARDDADIRSVAGSDDILQAVAGEIRALELERQPGVLFCPDADQRRDTEAELANVGVIAEQVPLGQPQVRPERLVQVGEAHGSIAETYGRLFRADLDQRSARWPARPAKAPAATQTAKPAA